MVERKTLADRLREKREIQKMEQNLPGDETLSLVLFKMDIPNGHKNNSEILGKEEEIFSIDDKELLLAD